MKNQIKTRQIKLICSIIVAATSAIMGFCSLTTIISLPKPPPVTPDDIKKLEDNWASADTKIKSIEGRLSLIQNKIEEFESQETPNSPSRPREEHIVLASKGPPPQLKSVKTEEPPQKTKDSATGGVKYWDQSKFTVLIIMMSLGLLGFAIVSFVETMLQKKKDPKSAVSPLRT